MGWNVVSINRIPGGTWYYLPLYWIGFYNPEAICPIEGEWELRCCDQQTDYLNLGYPVISKRLKVLSDDGTVETWNGRPVYIFEFENIDDPQCDVCEDADGDGYYAISPECSQGDDCDDNDPDTYPGAPEICDGNNKDNDCNLATVDECCPEISSFTGTNTSIDPLKGGRINLSGTFSESVDWTVNVAGKSFSGSGSSFSETWDGKDASGKVIEEGIYTAMLTITSDGCTDSESISFTVKFSEEDCKLQVDFGSTANIASGNLYHSQTLFQITNTKLQGDMTLSYNSLDSYSGPLGTGWTHAYNIRLVENNNDTYTLRDENGSRTALYKNGDYYTPETSAYPVLTKNPDDTYLLEHKDGLIYTFSPEGKITSIYDRNSNTITFSYDASGNLTSVTDSSGRDIYLVYDASNRISTITDPNNNIYSLTYNDDTLGSASTQHPELGTLTWSYTYDSNAFMLSKTDPQGYTTSYTYDENYKIAQSIDPEGNIKTVIYEPENTTSQLTEKDGGVWTYKYDTALGVLTEKTDPFGNTTTYQYDSDRNMISKTESDGSTTSYTYDADGNMMSTTDSLGNTTAYTYNSFGDITSITDPLGNTTTNSYDANGNLVSITDPAGAVTRMTYDARGNVITVTNPAGQTTTYTYDQNNNLISVTDPAGSTITFTYDASGNMLTQTNANGNTTTFEYNSLNQLVKITDSNGNSTTYTYDANGNKISETDANGNSTYYEYNYKGQLISVTDALGNITAYTYGGSGCPSCGGGGDKLTSITDANGNSTTYHYDTLGRLISETDPLENTISYAYDSVGNLISKTDANANAIAYSYDPLNRLVQKLYPDSTQETYSYNAIGNMLTAGNQHIAYSFTYDASGRVTSVTDSNGRTISYQYDNSGNKTQMTTPEGETVSYTYDPNNRLTQILSDTGNFGFLYDSLGRRTGLSYPNGVTTTYEYDSLGRLIELVTLNLPTGQAGSKPRTLRSFAYTHDNVGNRLKKTTQDRSISYQYDNIYRLMEALSSTPGWSTDKNKGKGKGQDKATENQKEYYTYDPVGNRLTSDHNNSYSYDEGNQLIAENGTVYLYDNNGNLILKSKSDKLTAYTYDYENRLIRLEKTQGDHIKVASFKYDPFGKRIEKSVTNDGETKTTGYFYDNEDILFEYDESGNIGNRYVHGPGIDEPLALEQKRKTYYYHADGLGSIVALTDATQKIVQDYQYDSFGNLKDQKNRIKQPYTYTSREWDRETGLYYYRARYYDAEVGRFINEDPILKGMNNTGGTSCAQAVSSFPIQSPQELNPYVYVGNNPINFVDPSGLLIGGDDAVIRKPPAPECDQDEKCPSGQKEVFHSSVFVSCLTAHGVLEAGAVACAACIVAPTPWVKIPACVVCAVIGTVIVLDCKQKATWCK